MHPGCQAALISNSGTLIEATYLPWSLFASLDTVPSAHSLRLDSIIADPSGRLATVQSAVARHFAEPGRVRRRSRALWNEIGQALRAPDPSAPLARPGDGMGVQDQLDCTPAAGSSDAPEMEGKQRFAFEAMTADPGIQSPADLASRAQAVIAFLPTLWEATEAILAPNPDPGS